jgi:FixJ family two-component response regulator
VPVQPVASPGRSFLDWLSNGADAANTDASKISICGELVSGAQALLAVVDDDESVRESLPDLLKQLGYAVEAFSSATAFLDSDHIDQIRCLILDVAMPGMSGPELQRELAQRGQKIPIIFITAHADATLRPSLLERGAVDCLLKPFSEEALLNALRVALGTP